MDKENPANLVRLYVDDELPPGKRREFEARLAANERLRQQVDFEQTLRERVAEVMRAGTPEAPAELTGRVRRALADSALAEPVATGRDSGEPAGQPPRLRRWLEDPRRANHFAVAATLALVAGAVLFGIFGRPIDRWADPGPQNPAADVALFASEEHNRCAGNNLALRDKATIRDFQALRREFRVHLGSAVPEIDLTESGYRFFGGGHCQVPGHIRSGHLVFHRPGPPDRFVSLFIVPDVGQFADQTALLQWYEADGGPQCTHVVLRSTDGALVYFLVCCDERDLERVARRVRAALAVR